MIDTEDCKTAQRAAKQAAAMEVALEDYRFHLDVHRGFGESDVLRKVADMVTALREFLHAETRRAEVLLDDLRQMRRALGSLPARSGPPLPAVCDWGAIWLTVPTEWTAMTPWVAKARARAGMPTKNTGGHPYGDLAKATRRGRIEQGSRGGVRMLRRVMNADGSMVGQS